MGERGAADDVADRVDVLHRRAQAPVDLDQAAVVELDAGLVEAERLDVGPAPGGDHEPVDLALLVAVGERDRRVAGLHVLDERAGVDLDVLLGERAAGDLRDVGVLGREHAVERLEQEHLRAHAPVGGRDLGAGRAGADHRQRLRQLLERPRLLGADHAAAEARAGDGLGDRAGREDHRLGLVLACRRRGRCRRAVTEPTPSMTSILFFFIRPPTPPVSVLMTLRRRSPTAPKSIVRLRHGDAEVGGLVDLGDDVGDAQHRLRRDAGVVEAAAADDVLLDDGGLHAELGRADRRHVPARPGSDDDAVVELSGMVAVEASRPASGRRAGSWIRAIARIRNQNSGPADAMIARHSSTAAARFDATMQAQRGEHDRDRRAAPRSRARPSSGTATCRSRRRPSARRRSAPPVDGLLAVLDLVAADEQHDVRERRARPRRSRRPSPRAAARRARAARARRARPRRAPGRGRSRAPCARVRPRAGSAGAALTAALPQRGPPARARSARAAASGSAASAIARTTTIRLAPCAVTSPTFAASSPPIANHGRGRVRGGPARRTRARPRARPAWSASRAPGRRRGSRRPGRRPPRRPAPARASTGRRSGRGRRPRAPPPRCRRPARRGRRRRRTPRRGRAGR